MYKVYCTVQKIAETRINYFEDSERDQGIVSKVSHFCQSVF